MNKQSIPEEEVENFISVYWQMLSDIESRTNPDTDILDKILVEGAHNLLRRSGIFNTYPRWEDGKCGGVNNVR
jgi:hypothetical protein